MNRAPPSGPGASASVMSPRGPGAGPAAGRARRPGGCRRGRCADPLRRPICHSGRDAGAVVVHAHLNAVRASYALHPDRARGVAVGVVQQRGLGLDDGLGDPRRHGGAADGDGRGSRLFHAGAACQRPRDVQQVTPLGTGRPACVAAAWASVSSVSQIRRISAAADAMASCAVCCSAGVRGRAVSQSVSAVMRASGVRSSCDSSADNCRSCCRTAASWSSSSSRLPARDASSAGRPLDWGPPLRPSPR